MAQSSISRLAPDQTIHLNPLLHFETSLNNDRELSKFFWREKAPFPSVNNSKWYFPFSLMSTDACVVYKSNTSFHRNMTKARESPHWIANYTCKLFCLVGQIVKRIDCFQLRVTKILRSLCTIVFNVLIRHGVRTFLQSDGNVTFCS